MQTNYDQVIENLKTVKTVKEWNEVREQAKDVLPLSDLIKIDQSGLIVDVLGADAYVELPPKLNHQWAG